MFVYWGPEVYWLHPTSGDYCEWDLGETECMIVGCLAWIVWGLDAVYWLGGWGSAAVVHTLLGGCCLQSGRLCMLWLLWSGGWGLLGEFEGITALLSQRMIPELGHWCSLPLSGGSHLPLWKDRLGTLCPNERYPLWVGAKRLTGSSSLGSLCENGINLDWSQLGQWCEGQVLLPY